MWLDRFWISAPKPTIPTREDSQWLADGEGVAGCRLLISNVVTSKEVVWYLNDVLTCITITERRRHEINLTLLKLLLRRSWCRRQGQDGYNCVEEDILNLAKENSAMNIFESQGRLIPLDWRDSEKRYENVKKKKTSPMWGPRLLRMH